MPDNSENRYLAHTIGIDPGLKGALAFLYAEVNTVTWAVVRPLKIKVFDMPVFDIIVNRKPRKVVDFKALRDLLAREELGPDRCVLEQAHPRPKDSNKVAFSSARGYGRTESALMANDMPFKYVSPVKWKRDMKVNHLKQSIRDRLPDWFSEEQQKLWTGPQGGFKDGRGEAALIAVWALTSWAADRCEEAKK